MRRRSFNIHERFLRHIWSRQYLTARLQTTDGRMLTVLDVGVLNSDGGPDFRNAKIKIGATTYTGDVEIHRTVFDWIQHQHQEDPKYNSVILHVVLEAGVSIPPTTVKSGRKVPVLVLGQYLSDSIHTIWQKAILDERTQKSEAIKCYGKNSNISTDTIEHWLEKLAVERLEIKLRRFEERLKQLAHEKKLLVREHQQLYNKFLFEGEIDEIPPPLFDLTQKDFSQKELWEQILYEGIMEGLGYSKNREPFLRLTKNVMLKQIRDWGVGDREEIESILFSVAGLLPSVKNINYEESRLYIRRLYKRWQEFRPLYKGEYLHEADWQFFPTRPTNFPTVRLSAASGIILSLLNNDLFRKSIQTIKDDSSTEDKENKLFSLLTTEVSDFWKTHYNFQKRSLHNVCALGKQRILEIIINAILPVALLYARIFKDRAVREGVLKLYRSLPAPESNSVTRLIEKQLLKKRIKLDSVCRHQSVIQLYKYYCTENRCGECEIGRELK